MPIITFSKNETNSAKDLYYALIKEKNVNGGLSFEDSLKIEGRNGNYMTVTEDGGLKWVLPEEDYIAINKHLVRSMPAIIRIYDKFEVVMKLVKVFVSDVMPDLKSLFKGFEDELEGVKEQRYLAMLSKFSKDQLENELSKEKRQLVDVMTEIGEITPLRDAEERMFGDASKKLKGRVNDLEQYKNKLKDRIAFIEVTLNVGKEFGTSNE